MKKRVGTGNCLGAFFSRANIRSRAWMFKKVEEMEK
jgi:hypothetical protein